MELFPAVSLTGLLAELGAAPSSFLLTFDAFDLATLYQVLALRQAVFIVEQTCPYQDADGRDTEALHLGLRDESGQLSGYARIFAPGEDGHAHFGRVISAPSHRGQGLGREVVRLCVGICRALWPEAPITISAQAHLQDFYGAFGFEGHGEVYLEDEIPHRDMTLAVGNL